MTSRNQTLTVFTVPKTFRCGLIASTLYMHARATNVTQQCLISFSYALADPTKLLPHFIIAHSGFIKQIHPPFTNQVIQVYICKTNTSTQALGLSANKISCYVKLTLNMYKLARFRKSRHQILDLADDLIKSSFPCFIHSIDKINTQLTVSHEFYKIKWLLPVKTQPPLDRQQGSLTLSYIVCMIPI